MVRTLRAEVGNRKIVGGYPDGTFSGERTFAWMIASRRLSKDYEISIQPDENMGIISHFATSKTNVNALRNEVA